MVIGTSMLVYPAAGLIHYAPVEAEKYYIDPAANENTLVQNLNVIREKAGMAVPALVEDLLKR